MKKGGGGSEDSTPFRKKSYVDPSLREISTRIKSRATNMEMTSLGGGQSKMKKREVSFTQDAILGIVKERFSYLRTQKFNRKREDGGRISQYDLLVGDIPLQHRPYFTDEFAFNYERWTFVITTSLLLRSKNIKRQAAGALRVYDVLRERNWVVDFKAVLARRALVELVLLERKAKDAAVYRNVRLALSLIKGKTFPPKMWEELLEEEEIRRESVDAGDWDGNGDYISHMASRKDFERYARRIREARRILFLSATLLAGLPFLVSSYLIIAGWMSLSTVESTTEDDNPEGNISFIMQASVASLVVPLGIIGASYWLEPLMDMNNSYYSNESSTNDEGKEKDKSTLYYSKEPTVDASEVPPLEVRFSNAFVLLLQLMLGMWGFMLTNMPAEDRTISTEINFARTTIVLHLIGLYPSLTMILSWKSRKDGGIMGILRRCSGLGRLFGVVYVPSASKWQAYGFLRFRCFKRAYATETAYGREKIFSHLQKLRVRQLQMKMRGFKFVTLDERSKTYRQQVVFNETVADIAKLERVVAEMSLVSKKKKKKNETHGVD